MPGRLLLLLGTAAALLLCGCAAKVELSSGTVKDNLQSITAVVTPEDLEKLGEYLHTQLTHETNNQ